MLIAINGLITPKNLDSYNDYRDVFPNLPKEIENKIADEVITAVSTVEIQAAKSGKTVPASKIIADFFRSVDWNETDPTALIFKLYILGMYIGCKVYQFSYIEGDK